jgi:outer membrane protein OmpA-like peptidoglycan-associated protein
MELNTHENAFIMIDGHTDNTGGNNINDALSFRRANAVKRYLTDMGANPKKMIAVGHGSRLPIADNNTAEGRAKNRRVIMTLRHANTSK